MLTLDDSVLHDVADEADPTECVALIIQMVILMNELNGDGLAAPQVGVSKRVIVFKHNGQDRAMINPQITRRYGDRKAKVESCLSFWGQSVKVRRKERIETVFLDTNGYQHAIRYRGRAARIIQHEIDHLDGITIV